MDVTESLLQVSKVELGGQSSISGEEQEGVSMHVEDVEHEMIITGVQTEKRDLFWG